MIVSNGNGNGKLVYLRHNDNCIHVYVHVPELYSISESVT